MKSRDFSRATILALQRTSWAIGPSLVLALAACGGGGGGGDGAGLTGELAADEAAMPQVESLAAQAIRKRKRTTTDPVTTDPVTTDPVTTDPVTTDPVTTDPVTTDPVTTDPAPAPAPAPSTNLIANPGFESGLTAWANWGNAAAVTGQAVSGTYALRVGTAAGGVGERIAAIAAGTAYRFSGQAKLSVAGETVYLGVKFFDAAGTTVLDKSVPVTATSYAGFAVDATAPANAATAMVYVWKNAGSGYAYVDDVALGAVSTEPAPTPTPTAPSTSTPTTSTPTTSTPTTSTPTTSAIPLAIWPNHLLQTGFDTDAYWIEDGVWGAGALKRGTYTGITGSTYEQYTGVSPNMGPNGEIAFRTAWKWPTGTTEVKSYPSVISGRKPGWYNTWTTPAGLAVRLLNGTNSTQYPSGATPGTFFPLQMPIASLKSSFGYTHMSTPTGRGHLTYDIWLQGTPTQVTGFSAPPITHEIMIPLNSWGGYGQHKIGRNPGWYDHDVTIDGRLFHVYVAKGSDGAVRPDFFGGWKFIVFQPSTNIEPGTLDLAKFINYVATRKDAFGTPWANGNEYAVSVELGVEPVDGTGDIQVNNYRVWK